MHITFSSVSFYPTLHYQRWFYLLTEHIYFARRQSTNRQTDRQKYHYKFSIHFKSSPNIIHSNWYLMKSVTTSVQPESLNMRNIPDWNSARAGNIRLQQLELRYNCHPEQDFNHSSDAQHTATPTKQHINNVAIAWLARLAVDRAQTSLSLLCCEYLQHHCSSAGDGGAAGVFHLPAKSCSMQFKVTLYNALKSVMCS